MSDELIPVLEDKKTESFGSDGLKLSLVIFFFFVLGLISVHKNAWREKYFFQVVNNLFII